MFYENFWTRERFPVVYEKNEAKAILVDIESFAKIETILDNLINREVEPEDGIITASTILQKILKEAKQDEPAMDWRKELDEI